MINNQLNLDEHTITRRKEKTKRTNNKKKEIHPNLEHIKGPQSNF